MRLTGVVDSSPSAETTAASEQGDGGEDSAESEESREETNRQPMTADRARSLLNQLAVRVV